MLSIWAMPSVRICSLKESRAKGRLVTPLRTGPWSLFSTAISKRATRLSGACSCLMESINRARGSSTVPGSVLHASNRKGSAHNNILFFLGKAGFIIHLLNFGFNIANLGIIAQWAPEGQVVKAVCQLFDILPSVVGAQYNAAHQGSLGIWIVEIGYDKAFLFQGPGQVWIPKFKGGMALEVIVLGKGVQAGFEQLVVFHQFLSPKGINFTTLEQTARPSR